MSQEIGYFARNYKRDRAELKEFTKQLLSPERYKITKGLMWLDDEGVAMLEAALNRPEEPKTLETEFIEVIIMPGAKNSRFEYAATKDRGKIGVMIPMRMKGKFMGRRVMAEVMTSNDGVKSYRLQCPQFGNTK